MIIPILADITAPDISSTFTNGVNPFTMLRSISSNPTTSGMRDGGIFRDLTTIGFRTFLAFVLSVALVSGLIYLAKYGIGKKPQDTAASKSQVIKYVLITILASCGVGIMNAILYLAASTFGVTIY